jgi:assimilatory nitrate reductase catalytic subunit
VLDVHPADAEQFGLADGGLARVESPHGATMLPVRLSSDLRQGEAFAPMHWNDRFTSAGPIDTLVGAATDPISGQPELKATPVRVAPVAPHWHGLLLRGSEQVPRGPYYWARVPLERGHAFTLIGCEALPSDSGSKFWISALLDAPPAAELVIYVDPARGTFRYASVVGRRLEACLFIAARASALPARDALAALLGTRLDPDARALVLAGALAGAAAESAAGKTICACFGVGLHTLHGAIAQRRVTNVAEIGAVLRAGTNCGSCIPELRAILSGAQMETSAA